MGPRNSETTGINIAKMTSPSGWVEQGHTPQFDEFTLI
jgi:hypothetical protein